MYSILIKVDGIEKRKRSASFLHLLIGFFLITKAADYYRLTNYQTLLPTIPVYTVALFSLLYGLFKRKIDFSGKYNGLLRFVQMITFITVGLSMIRYGRSIDYIGAFLWAGLSLMLLLSERKVFNDTNLLIDKQGLTVPGYYSNHFISWDSLSDCVMRQDFVTIFHKKNKYLQYQVFQSLSDLEVAQINSFCQEQLNVTKKNDVNYLNSL